MEYFNWHKSPTAMPLIVYQVEQLGNSGNLHHRNLNTIPNSIKPSICQV